MKLEGGMVKFAAASWCCRNLRVMVGFMENPQLEMDDDWGYPYDLGNVDMLKSWI